LDLDFIGLKLHFEILKESGSKDLQEGERAIVVASIMRENLDLEIASGDGGRKTETLQITNVCTLESSHKSPRIVFSTTRSRGRGKNAGGPHADVSKARGKELEIGENDGVDCNLFTQLDNQKDPFFGTLRMRSDRITRGKHVGILLAIKSVGFSPGL